MPKKTPGPSKKKIKKWKAKLKKLQQSLKKSKKEQQIAKKEYQAKWKKLKVKIKPFKQAFLEAQKKRKKKQKAYLSLKEAWEKLSVRPEALKRAKIEEAEAQLISEELVEELSDNLKKIEGIGPKIASILNQAGIRSYATLAETKQEYLVELLQKAGPHFRMHDPASWPMQARLAASAQWEALKAFQHELK